MVWQYTVLYFRIFWMYFPMKQSKFVSGYACWHAICTHPSVPYHSVYALIRFTVRQMKNTSFNCLTTGASYVRRFHLLHSLLFSFAAQWIAFRRALTAKGSWHVFIDLHRLYACNPVCSQIAAEVNSSHRHLFRENYSYHRGIQDGVGLGKSDIQTIGVQGLLLRFIGYRIL